MSKRILLFIPIYNCGKQIARLLSGLNHEIQSNFCEIVVVDNISTDNSREAVIQAFEKMTSPKLTLIRNRQNYGLGGSHKVAFNYALNNAYDFCIVLHGDDQGDIRDILPLISSGEHLRYDCLLNSRFMPGSKRFGYSSFRTVGNIVFNLLFSFATRRLQWDLGSGLCCYSKPFLESGILKYCNDDLTFNYTLQLHAASRSISQKFFPSSWREDDQISNVKLARQTWQMIKLLASYSFFNKKYIKKIRDNLTHDYAADIVYQKESAL